MASIDTLVTAWDEAIWEHTLVFEGLEDGDVWRRPAPALLSVGELTAHVAYYEAFRSTEPAPASYQDGVDLPIRSPLIDPAFRYYSVQVENPVDLGIGAAAMKEELERIHGEAKRLIAATPRDTEDLVAGQDQWTWGAYVRYLAFHAAYHAGQAYSVRHLLGHATTDN